MLHFLRRNFGYSKKECIGVVVLLSTITCFSLYFLYNRYSKKDLSEEKILESEVADLNNGIEKIKSQDISHNTEQATSREENNYSKKKSHRANQDIKEKNNYPKNSDNNKKKIAAPNSINLNTATAEDLQAIRGIGQYFSNKIVKYRAKIGGFVDLEQLKAIEKLSESTINNLINSIYIDKTFKPILININSATFKEFLKLPYMDYEVVKKIFNYKNKNKKFHSTDELRELLDLSDKEWTILQQYIGI